MKSLEENYLADILEVQQDRLNAIGNGKAEDYASYKYTCGVIYGLQIAKEVFAQHMQKMQGDSNG